MELNELKNSMSTLEQVLAKTNSDIKINVSASETAQTKILGKYRKNMLSCAILAIVFVSLWIGNVNPDKLPNIYKASIAAITAIAAVWYALLYFKLKNVRIASTPPATLVAKTATIKLLAYAGELFFVLVLTVFFTCLLSDMLVMNRLAFWLIVVTLFAGLLCSAFYIWPRCMKLFRELHSIKE